MTKEETKRQIPTLITDKNGQPITPGSIIDIHQTVNGQSRFVVLEVDSLDVRYAHDLLRKYEYDVGELLDLDVLLSDKEIEIVGNIYNYKPLAE